MNFNEAITKFNYTIDTKENGLISIKREHDAFSEYLIFNMKQKTIRWAIHLEIGFFTNVDQIHELNNLFSHLVSDAKEFAKLSNYKVINLESENYPE